MQLRLFSCAGGHIVLPPSDLVLIDRMDGGQLGILPPRDVWDRSELSLKELTAWSTLIAATGRAMLNVLPQLEDGCINYWDAGNWGLNTAAEPNGPKQGKAHRRLHMNVLGRSPNASAYAWRWGEAPMWPEFSNRYAWAKDHQRLTPPSAARLWTRSNTY